MKTPILIAALLLSASTYASAQGYESQYPYDPYSPTPQPQQTSYYGGGGKSYQNPGNVSGGSYGGDFDKLLTYGYLSAHYAYNDFKGDNKLDGDSGFGVDLGVELMKPLFLHFGLDRITSEVPNAKDLEVTSVSAGIGVYIPVASRFHIFGEAGVRYDWVNDDYKTIYTDDIAPYVRGGVRLAVTEKLELSAAALFNNTDNFNEFVIEVDAYYAVLSWLDINLGVDFSEDINSYQIGGRWRW